MLDTNICIYLIKQQPPEVGARFSQFYYGDIGISTITLAELNAGLQKSTNQIKAKQALDELLQDLVIVPFDELAAAEFGIKRWQDSNRQKNAMDRLIASHAASIGCTLVTNNLSDFTCYADLKVENWVAAN
jgi:tRNA(fMet)-specific endonuclease VapC